MRIVLVSPYDLAVPGGVQSHVLQLRDALLELGDEVVLVSPGKRSVDEAHLAVGRSVPVPYNGARAPVGLTPAAWPRTVRAIRSVRPDVVHVHEPLVPWVGLAASHASTPVVGTFHAWSDTQRLYRLARPVGREVMHRLHAMIAVSDAAASYHAAALQVPPSRFVVVPNGVDVARFVDASPLPSVHDPSRPTLLFVGRLERRKGLEPLVRAFTRLKTERPDLRLVVVGEGPERDRCQALLPTRLRGDVLFLGRVDPADLPGCYAAADVYVSPALGGESFGIVLLEAMAAGRAIVASDLPGYRSVVRDDVQGRLVTPGDPAALAAAIGPLLDNPSLRTAMGAEGRRTVGAYDWPVVARRVRELYVGAVG